MIVRMWLLALGCMLAALPAAAQDAGTPSAGTTHALLWIGVIGGGAAALLLLLSRAGKGEKRLGGDDGTPLEGKGEEAAKSAAAPPAEAEAPGETKDAPAGPEEADAEGRKATWGLGKTRREGFVGRLRTLLAGKETVDSELFDQLEETLFKADIGVRTTEKLLEALRGELADGLSPDRVWSFLRERSIDIVTLDSESPPVTGEGPEVLLVVGVNGSGKTTSIGKLAAQHIAAGRSVLLVAGDTFRAAATDQLAVWADRVGAKIVKGAEGADPASVIFDGIDTATKEGIDLVIADTAGRLHTQKPLMDELEKVHRVCGKARDGAPHETLLVVDSTNGQNAILQARDFNKAIKVTGIVLTKLDGTAKGGVVLGVCDELQIPIRYIGVGEQAEDLRRFSPKAFVDALFGSDAP